MRILALVPGGIADQILFFPTLVDLKEKYPNAIVDVIVEPKAKSAYRVCSQVNKVLTFEFFDRNGLVEYFDLFGKIREVEYDITVNAVQDWNLGLLLWLNGIPVRVGYEMDNAWMLSKPVPLNSKQYLAHQYHDLVKGLDVNKPCPKLQVSIPDEDLDWADAERSRLDIKESGYILFHSFTATDPDRVYPVSQWERIVRDIANTKPNLPVVLLNNQDNDEWVETMIADIPNLKVTQPSDVGKEAAIIAAADRLICTESAAMQLSVAVNTYTVGIFGYTDVSRVLPVDNDRIFAVEPTTARSISSVQPGEVLTKLWGN